MNIVVALKEAALVQDAFEVEDEDIPERFLEYELNEWDEYALETGVALVEEGVGEEVVTVTIGPQRSEETIRKALAKGADRAIRVWDSALAERRFLDSRTKARILAAVLRDESPDLVLTGVQSDDDMFGATGVGLAERLDFGWAAVVNHLEVDVDTSTAHVRRELEAGVEEIATVSLPAICTIQTGINEPRYASLRGIRMAQRAEIETQTLDDLNLDSTVLDGGVRLRWMRKPVTESTAEIYEGEPEETATRLAEYLRERGVGAP